MFKSQNKKPEDQSKKILNAQLAFLLWGREPLAVDERNGNFSQTCIAKEKTAGERNAVRIRIKPYRNGSCDKIH